MPGKGMPPSRTRSPDLAAKLTAWQETADEDRLAEVVMEARPQLEAAARCVLRRLGIGDWSAVDDAVSLVLDHLRRLPQAAAGERAVAQFDAGHATAARAGDRGSPISGGWPTNARSTWPGSAAARGDAASASPRRPVRNSPTGPTATTPEAIVRGASIHGAIHRPTPPPTRPPGCTRRSTGSNHGSARW